MHMSEENWQEAQADFSAAFNEYDDAGSDQRTTVLRYLLLTTMLAKSNIDPFDSSETGSFKNHPSIVPMRELVEAYQRNDIFRYEQVLQGNKDLLQDAFIAENIDEITRTMRMKAVLKLVAPYTRFSLAFVAEQLRIEVAEVQSLVGFLILDGALQGAIDQEQGLVEMTSDPDAQRTEAMARWTAAARSLWTSVLNEGEGFRVEDSMQALSSGLGTGFPDTFGSSTRAGPSRGAVNGHQKLRGAMKRSQAA